MTDTVNSIFDCPEPTHTSPTSTSCTWIVLLPAMVMSYGPPGFSFVNRTIQRPSAPATALRCCFRKVTVTFSPGAAVPHTGTDIPLCNTAWSLNSGEGFTSACETAESSSISTGREAKRVIRGLRMIVGSILMFLTAVAA